ncbi:MAG: hypothetical protein ACK5AZ_00880 [Bryobacteraceae bacterium]
METVTAGSRRTWTLPPLILHPFADAVGPNKLVESSRASLMLQGLLPSGEATREELDRRLLDGRYCEIRMLYYVGLDVQRWIEQCLEMVRRDDELAAAGLNLHSFASLLIHHTPEAVKSKLKRWGVSDYKSIFVRALGLNTIFSQVPERDSLADDFIRNYYRYADQIYAANHSLTPLREVDSSRFQFDLYASGEYTRLLEREWDNDGEFE